jgi:hypothetical protein
MNCTAIAALQSLTTFSFAHLVKYSIVVIIYLALVHLLGGLIGPTNSMAHFSNTCNVNCHAKGISYLREGFPTL